MNGDVGEGRTEKRRGEERKQVHGTVNYIGDWVSLPAWLRRITMEASTNTA